MPTEHSMRSPLPGSGERSRRSCGLFGFCCDSRFSIFGPYYRQSTTLIASSSFAKPSKVREYVGSLGVVETAGLRLFSQQLTAFHHCTGSLPLIWYLILRRTLPMGKARGYYVFWSKGGSVEKRAFGGCRRFESEFTSREYAVLIGGKAVPARPRHGYAWLAASYTSRSHVCLSPIPSFLILGE